ncbi:MAG: AMIN domain-containing protein, partial [Myxococcota bacterium]
MRMTKTLRRWPITLGGLGVGLCLLIAAPLTLSATGANLVMDVKVEGSGSGRIVRIQTSKEPTFTVFRLSNPMRVVVDISGGDISRLASPLQFDDGVVTSIATRQFDANGFLIGRLTVGFEHNLAYDVKAEGRSVVIRTAASGATLSQRRVVTPSAPLAENASQRVDELRREVETARRNAEREKQQAKSAQAQAAKQLADAERLASAAEERAREAADAKAEAAKLRAEA